MYLVDRYMFKAIYKFLSTYTAKLEYKLVLTVCQSSHLGVSRQLLLAPNSDGHPTTSCNASPESRLLLLSAYYNHKDKQHLYRFLITA